MAKCDRCGKYTDDIFEIDKEHLCWFCFKKQDLKDQRDWEDDPITEESEE